jgi:ABC-type transporter Mla subunit MlaD
MEARYLTSADVSRRLGVEGGTVRHYAEILRELGFPMPQDPTGAYLWSPELVEVARAAYAMAKATKGLSFREAVELILYAGEAAQHAKAGRSILTLLHQALSLPARLEEVAADVQGAVADVQRAAIGLQSVGRDIRRDVYDTLTSYRGTLEQFLADYWQTMITAASEAAAEVRQVAEEAREVVREASAGGWLPPVALLLVAMGVALFALAKGGLAALGGYLIMLAVGGFLGWWARG